MSQVKNLRAMFENKGDDASPPERGRSGASTPIAGANANGTESPRPLSKVRTNFVAIEKDGRIGLRRDPSHESSVSRRRLSMETDISTSTVPDKASLFSDENTKASKPFFQEPIPESPRQPPASSEQPNTTDRPVINEPKSAPDKSTAPAGPNNASSKQNQAVPAASDKKAKSTNGKTLASPTKDKTKSTPRKATPRPAALSVKASSTRPPPKSPLTAATKTATPRMAAKSPEKTGARKAASTPTNTAAKRTAGPVPKKVQPLKPASSDTGFVKPKPKSPTRPDQLPASLMAPTASSVSKGKNSRQPVLRPPAAAARPVSRASSSATGATSRRQSSNAQPSRPSIGPPPKKTASNADSTKKDAPVDEGFLARMMRPTQSSSSKTSDKAAVTPPRKTGVRSAASTTDSTSGSGKRGKVPASLTSPAEKSQVSSSTPSIITPTKVPEPSFLEEAQKSAEEKSSEETQIQPEPVEEPSEENARVGSEAVDAEPLTEPQHSEEVVEPQASEIKETEPLSKPEAVADETTTLESEIAAPGEKVENSTNAGPATEQDEPVTHGEDIEHAQEPEDIPEEKADGGEAHNEEPKEAPEQVNEPVETVEHEIEAPEEVEAVEAPEADKAEEVLKTDEVMEAPQQTKEPEMALDQKQEAEAVSKPAEDSEVATSELPDEVHESQPETEQESSAEVHGAENPIAEAAAKEEEPDTKHETPVEGDDTPVQVAEQ